MELIYILIPTTILVFSGLLISLQGSELVCAGKLLSSDLRLVLEKTPALDNFIFVIAQVVSLAVLLSNLVHISNHIVISLDILYLASLLLLVLFQILKDSLIAS